MLSLSKLERLLSTKGFIIKKVFIMHNMCIYLEILSLVNADTFLLYIPSKYEIGADGHSDVYKINYIEMRELDNLADDYAGEPDNLDLETVYNEIDIDMSPDKKHKNDFAGHLEERYKRPISLKNITKKDKKDLKDIYRQLNRLKFCVLSIKYKLSIQFKNYMACIRRNGTIDCYLIKNSVGKPQRRLMVVIDLETLYNKLDSIQLDIKTVREGIYKVLDKNQQSHSKTLRKMLEEKSDVSEFSDVVYKKKFEYTNYISKLELLLSQLCESEKKTVEKLVEVEEKYNSVGIKGLHTDIERSHVMTKYETELEKINGVKQEIIKNILTLKTKCEDTFLFVDGLLFDNSIMMDAVFKNMNKARQYTN